MRTKIGYVLRLKDTNTYFGELTGSWLTEDNKYREIEGITDEVLFFDSPETAIKFLSNKTEKEVKRWKLSTLTMVIETVLLNLDEDWTRLIKWITKK